MKKTTIIPAVLLVVVMILSLSSCFGDGSTRHYEDYYLYDNYSDEFEDPPHNNDQTAGGTNETTTYKGTYYSSVNASVYQLNNGHGYAYFKEKLTWTEAHLRCQELGGHLITISATDEQDLLNALVKGDYVWLGATDARKEGTWEWITGESFSYKKFKSGEPSNSGGTEHYLGTYTSTGEWNDFNYDSGTPVGFVCEWSNMDAVAHAKPNYRYVDEIRSVQELKAINGTPGAYMLANDIDLSGSEWEPIANFPGILLGQGHIISGLTIKNGNQARLGLFATLTGTVDGVIMDQVDIRTDSNKNNVGAIAGYSYGTVYNCVVDGRISAPSCKYVGGLVGALADDGYILSSYNYASVTGGAADVGGIAGNSHGVVADCFNEGDVTGVDSVGGIAGYAILSIKNSENIGTITGTGNAVGGIVGYTNGVTLENLTNRGIVTASGSYVGGILGRNVNNHIKGQQFLNEGNVTGKSYVGGIFGNANAGSEISDAVNEGVVTGEHLVGGILGSTSAKIMKCTNNGAVFATGAGVWNRVSASYTGGIAGWTGSDMEKCTNNGSVTAPSHRVGGIVGYSQGAGIIECVNAGVVHSSNGNAIGGIVGFCGADTFRIEASKCEADVTGVNQVGGFIGYHGDGSVTILSSENRGTIYGTDGVAGFVGWKKSGSFYFENCTNYGNVFGTNAEGFIGKREGTVTIDSKNSSDQRNQ